MATRDPASAYLRALRDARARGFTLAVDAQARLRLAFRAAARTIELGLTSSGDPVTDARARALRDQILGVLAELEQTTLLVAARATRLTISEVVAIHQAVVTELLAAEGLPTATLLAGFSQLNVRVAVVLAARRPVTLETLVNRHIAEAQPALDRLLAAAITRGVSTRELTRDVAGLLAKAEGADLTNYALDQHAVTGLRTLHFDARRIAVSETLNTLREASASSLIASPIILAVKWQPSGRHDGLPSSPDECTILASEDFYGFGPGYYPPSRWPLAPHPLCMCSQGGPTLFRPPSEWGTPAPAPAAMRVNLDTFEVGRVVGGTEDWSDRRTARARATLQAALFDQVGRRARRAA